MKTDGFNHVAVLTQDLERFCEFYGEVFGARVEHEEHDGPVRMRVVRIGQDACLNVFEVSFSREAWRDDPFFLRGRLDHLALNVPDRATFDRLVVRLVELGLSEGKVNDFGKMQSVSFRDPDGMWLEVCVPDERAQQRAWRTPEDIRAGAEALA